VTGGQAGGQRRALTTVTACALTACALAALCLAASAAAHKPLSKAAYDKEMTAIGTSVGGDLKPVGAARTGHSEELALVKLQGELGAIGRELAAITPPGPVKADHALLVAAVQEFEREVGPVIATLKARHTSALASILELKGLLAIESTVAAINTAGYSIG